MCNKALRSGFKSSLPCSVSSELKPTPEKHHSACVPVLYLYLLCPFLGPISFIEVRPARFTTAEKYEVLHHGRKLWSSLTNPWTWGDPENLFHQIWPHGMALPGSYTMAVSLGKKLICELAGSREHKQANWINSCQLNWNKTNVSVLLPSHFLPPFSLTHLSCLLFFYTWVVKKNYRHEGPWHNNSLLGKSLPAAVIPVVLETNTGYCWGLITVFSLGPESNLSSAERPLTPATHLNVRFSAHLSHLFRKRQCQRDGMFPFIPYPQPWWYYNFNAWLISSLCLVSGHSKPCWKRLKWLFSSYTQMQNWYGMVMIAVPKYNSGRDKLKQSPNKPTTSFSCF